MSTSLTCDVTGLMRVRDQRYGGEAKAEQTAKGLGVARRDRRSARHGLPGESDRQRSLRRADGHGADGLRPDAQTMTLTITVGYRYRQGLND
jgi:hypothetical protein